MAEYINPLKAHSEQKAKELKEANKRILAYGENKLREKKKKTNLQRFLDQFKDVMILILLAAAGVSFVLSALTVSPPESEISICSGRTYSSALQ